MQDLFLDPLSEPAYWFVPGEYPGCGARKQAKNLGQNGVLRELSPSLPEQQQWLDSLSGAYSGGPGGLGRGSKHRFPDVLAGNIAIKDYRPTNAPLRP
eukprot:1157565-Pelagomonas_calceolata.AAC.6